ncbi:methyltransferase [Nocardia sp. NPDC047648]|uniref:methyltransferase n=1 Tax=Nocardia sp. NPDC047648 TaxID=3155625 RepID=UPI0033D242B6
MTKLTKRAEAAHREALRLVDLSRDLTDDEKRFILDNYRSSTSPRQVCDAAFFTPLPLASQFKHHVHGTRIIDLCAGIGNLTFPYRDAAPGDPPRMLVCVERNREYVRVGRKVLPEARWYCQDVLRLAASMPRQFHTAIANPPFGAGAGSATTGGYRGRRFEYHVIAAASRLAERGVFLVPRSSAPFTYDGRDRYRAGDGDPEYQRFTQATGIVLGPNVGIDTSLYDDLWHHRPPATEVVTCDFRSATRSTPPGSGRRAPRVKVSP